jgi:hypothetical protein
VNLPTLVTTANASAFAADTGQPLGFAAATFQNSAMTSFGNPLPRGVYQAGLSFTITAAGAVNDNTYRFAFITTRNFYSAASAPDKYAVFQTCFEANTGNGMDMGIHTVIESDGNDVVRFWAQHGNTSSSCAVTNGICWVTRLSDLDAPRVVI